MRSTPSSVSAIARGYLFASQTDTEVIAHLVDALYEGDLFEAVQQATLRLRGAYAIAVFCRDEPERVVGARLGSPLVLGVAPGERFLASDAMALAGVTDQIVYLEEGDLVDLQLGKHWIAARDQLGAQFLVVLDDAVVDQRDAPGAAVGRPRPAGEMRMRVVLSRPAVRGPARVRDAGAALDAVAGDQRLQFGHPSGAAAAAQAAALVDRHAAGVVAAVFEAPQALDQDGNDVACADGADDAAHAGTPRAGMVAIVRKPVRDELPSKRELRNNQPTSCARGAFFR